MAYRGFGFLFAWMGIGVYLRKLIYSTMSTFGYQANFLGEDFPVLLPEIPSGLISDVAPLTAGGIILDYPKYSVVLHKFRKLPLITAANIEGGLFKDITRKSLFSGGDHWRKDDRIAPEYQLGAELYGAEKSDFDRGHMVKREDVQWGISDDEAADSARSTFYFTNAAPQHAKVNQSIWRQIEDYILKTESVKNGLKISVFTGPVLTDQDPEFVTLVKGEVIKLPVLFWKLVYYINEANTISRVAFLVGQQYLLEKAGIVLRKYAVQADREHFMNFKDADTYQVNTELIHKLTGLHFPVAHDPYQKESPVKLVLDKVNVRRGQVYESVISNRITGLTL
ncbi:MAG TPA: DNA/RNA non-specific endonuclease [Saprospiraceae bacterium]|nr:DNA/RNA non-specific endonuclease [Saprospiraceae bacterium]